MATDAEVRKISTQHLCLLTASDCSVEQGIQHSHAQMFRNAGPALGNNWEIGNADAYKFCFGNLRRAYEWQEASPQIGWSRLPKHLPSSARSLLFIAARSAELKLCAKIMELNRAELELCAPLSAAGSLLFERELRTASWKEKLKPVGL